jgi:cytoplasmic iron level regulating protein YaaA (DUF328/UPF0246 family)
MLIVVSPSKTFDFETPAHTRRSTQPVFLVDSKQLIEELRKLSPAEICSLMSASEKLGELTHERIRDWQLPFTRDNAKQAVLAFKGDLYNGLEAESLSTRELGYAQKHLRILSGLHATLSSRIGWRSGPTSSIVAARTCTSSGATGSRRS